MRIQGKIAAALRSPFARSSAGVFVMRGCAVGLNYAALVIMTRTLGKGGYGVYALAMAWLSLLTIPGMLGLDRLVVREVAAACAREAWGRVKGLLRWANGVAIVSACATAVVGMIVAGILHRWGYVREGALGVMLVIFAVLPVNVLSNVRQAALRGLHEVVRGFVPDLVVWPGVVCAGVAVMRWGFRDGASAMFAAWVVVGASVLAFGVGAWLLKRAVKPEIRAAAAEVDVSGWGRALVPLMLVSAMYTVNSRMDQAMIGAWKGSGAVGIYATGVRVADIVIFFIVAINAILAPTVARLYARGERAGMQRIVTQTARWIGGLSIPAAVVIFVFSEQILALFGPGFGEGAWALRWLSCGQVVNACAGSVALLLTTTGHERDALKGITLGAIVNVVLNAALIPKYGINGAAVATAISTVVWNVTLGIMVKRRLGINPTLFGKLVKKEEEAA